MDRQLPVSAAVLVVGIAIGWAAGVISSPRINLANQANHLDSLHAADSARQHALALQDRAAAVEAMRAATAAAGRIACEDRVWELAQQWMIPQLASGRVRLSSQ